MADVLSSWLGYYYVDQLIPALGPTRRVGGVSPFNQGARETQCQIRPAFK